MSFLWYYQSKWLLRFADMKLKSVFRLKTNVKRQHSFMDSHQNGKQSCPLALMIQQAGRLTQFSKVGNTLNDKLRLIFFLLRQQTSKIAKIQHCSAKLLACHRSRCFMFYRMQESALTGHDLIYLNVILQLKLVDKCAKPKPFYSILI